MLSARKPGEISSSHCACRTTLDVVATVASRHDVSGSGIAKAQGRDLDADRARMGDVPHFH
jgi:hypothetical protein